MSTPNGERRPTSGRPLSALPSVQARILAFVAILVAGIAGGLIGFSTVKVGCRHACGTPEGMGGLLGAVVAAGGVAVIAVLVLRAMGEWRSIREQRELEMAIAAAAAVATPPAPGEPAPPAPGEPAPPGPNGPTEPADQRPPGQGPPGQDPPGEVPPATGQPPP